MSLSPLLAAGPLTVAHAGAAVVALGLGTAQLIGPKGVRIHRILGWCWVALIAFVALGSFGIHGLRQLGPFSWIHLLSIFTLAMLAVAVAHARSGHIEAHRWSMIGLFLGSLVIAGLFTLMPGRIMHQVFFG